MPEAVGLLKGQGPRIAGDGERFRVEGAAVHHEPAVVVFRLPLVGAAQELAVDLPVVPPGIDGHVVALQEDVRPAAEAPAPALFIDRAHLQRSRAADDDHIGGVDSPCRTFKIGDDLEHGVVGGIIEEAAAGLHGAAARPGV